MLIMVGLTLAAGIAVAVAWLMGRRGTEDDALVMKRAALRSELAADVSGPRNRD